MPPNPYSTDRPDQDGEQSIGATDARGGRRVGRIRVLVLSLAAAVILVFGYWAIDARHLRMTDHPGDVGPNGQTATGDNASSHSGPTLTPNPTLP